jgi:hypothetical protein
MIDWNKVINWEAVAALTDEQIAILNEIFDKGD